MAPHETLYQLLLSLFSPAEFRMWLRHGPDGPAIVAALPDSAPATLLVAEAVALLERRGHLDAAFFARLSADFPRRRGQIAAAELAWSSGQPVPAATPAEPAPPAAPGSPSGISIQGVRGDVVLNVGRDLIGVDNSTSWWKRRG